MTDEATQKHKRKRAQLRCGSSTTNLPIISRDVPLDISYPTHVTIWEAEHPADLLEEWAMMPSSSSCSRSMEPCGVVMWPGSILAARELYRRREEIKDKRVLVLGAGCGVEAQVAALLGASCVIAADINPMVLRILEYGVQQAGLDQVVESHMFDLFDSNQRLPEADVIVASDVTYDEALGREVGRRLLEVLDTDKPPGVIMIDSQRFAGCNFLPTLNDGLAKAGRTLMRWEERSVQVTTSAYMTNGSELVTKNGRVMLAA